MATSGQMSYYEGEQRLSKLAHANEELAKLYSDAGWIDVHNPRAMRLVTTAVLKRDFDLDVELPDDRLCPPVSNRWNYVRWIQELLDTSSPTYTDAYDPDRRVTGLDIGTGASAIYPILALKTRPSWYMCATDIDERSLTYAKKNLQVNGLEPRAQVLLTEPSDPLIPLSALGFEKLDFTMCNPPFFSTEEEMNNSLQGKGKNDKPRSICTGTPTEMVCSGGDLGFVSRIFDESKKLHDKVQWYSAMFGKLASANAMVQKLRENKVSNFAVCNLFVSGKTRRWAVAWSFGDLRPTDDVARHDLTPRMLGPPATAHEIFFSTEPTAVAKAIDEKMKLLYLRWSFDPHTRFGRGIAAENVWCRHYRRKLKRKADEIEEGSEGGERKDGHEKGVAVAFAIVVLDQYRVVNVRWLRGTDESIWESLTGMIRTVVGTAEKLAERP